MAQKRKKRGNFQHRDNQFMDYDTATLVHNEIRELFNKKITLKERHQQWTLPPSDLLFKDDPFTVRELLSLKKELNATKSLLNDMDIDEWHQHTRRMHKAGLVVKNLRENHHAEMCTQAWAKFQEILGTYNLIPNQAHENKQVNTVHLCEAPGAFIACMNHHLKNNVPGVKWHWKGTTLSPYYEGNDLNAMLDDDSFIFKTRENWNFGQDGTGDLMNLENLMFLKQDCAAMGAVHLVTADGSINCADDPGEQEKVVSQLIFCESLAAMEVLCDGGNYVVKMFTALEYHMVTMLYLLCCVFKEVHFIKPATSKGGNSEVYVICMNYCRSNLPQGYREILHGVYNGNIPHKALFPLKCLPADFIERLQQCQLFYIDKQKNEIVENIKSFHMMTKQHKHFIYHVKNQTVQHYINVFKVKPLAESDYIVRECHLDGVQYGYRGDVKQYFSNRRKCGTYNERHDKTWLQILQQDELFEPKAFTSLEEMRLAKNGMQLLSLLPEDVEWLEGANKSEIKFSFAKGKMMTNILNSRFCSSYYITKLNTAIDNTADKEWSRVPQLLPADACVHCNYYSIAVLDHLVKFTERKVMSLLLGIPPPCRCFDHYLQSQGVHLHSQSQSVDLVIVPVLDSVPPEYGISHSLEVKIKKSLLNICISTLKVLNPGGTFVCQLYTSLSRFTVGILYILHCLFQRIAVIKPVTGCLCCPNRFIVCQGYIGFDQDILSSLIESHDLLVTCQPHEDLLEVIDMKCLYEEKFFWFVKKMNEQLAHVQLVDIVNRESFDVGVVKEHNAALAKEAMNHFKFAVNK